MNRKVLGLGAVALLAVALGVTSIRSHQPPASEGRPAVTKASAPAPLPPAGFFPAPDQTASKLNPAALKALAHHRVFMESTPAGEAVRGETYQASVEADGLFLSSPDVSLRMRPVTLEAGAAVVALEPGVAVRAGVNVAQVLRPQITEEYIFENNRVEQLFHIAQAPAEGELRVKVAVEGDYRIEKVRADQNGWRDVQMKDGGLIFRNPDGRAVMSYHSAVAIDAAGRRQTLYPDVEGNQIVLAVPDTFMATAAFPVVIDPWLELNQSAQGGGVSLSAKVSEGLAMALDNSGNPYVVWSDNSSGNFDIYLRYFNGFEWTDLGGSSKSGGISKNAGKSSHPSITMDPSLGTPAVAWDDDTSGDFDIYVRVWTGTAWGELLGSATAGGISRQAGLSLYPSIGFLAVRGDFFTTTSIFTNFDIVPIVVWQQDVAGVSEIFGRFFFPGDSDSMSGWYALGSLNISGTPGSVSERPRLLMNRFGQPFVTWQDTANGNFEVYLKGFLTTSGNDPFLLQGATSNSQVCYSVVGGNVPVSTIGTALETGYIPDSGLFTVVGPVSGVDWTELAGSASGGGVSNTAGPSFFPAIAIDGGLDALYLAWQEGPVTQPPPLPPTLNTNVYVRRLALAGAPGPMPPVAADYAASWAELNGSGSATGISGTGRSQYPSIAVAAGLGLPVVAWEDDTSTAGVGTIDQPEIFVRQFFGGVWQDVGDAGSSVVQGGISASPNMSTRPVILSAGQGQFVCAWQDGALGSFDVFLKRYFLTDLAPLSLDQLDSLGSIVVGAATAETTIRLRANVRGESVANPLVSGVFAQFEVRPTGTPFIGTATVSTSLGTPTNTLGTGNVVEALFSGSPNVRYAWRARAVDQIGRTGPWQSFGGNADTVTDFEVRLTIATPAPTGLDQRRSDAITQIPLGATTTESSVVFVGSVVPPDASTQVRFEVEVVPVASVFSGTATAVGSLVSGASTIVLSHPALTDGSYKWRARAVPEAGSTSPASGWVDFGGNLGTEADFVVQSPAPSTLGQFFLDGTTPLPTGGVTSESGVVMSGVVTSPVAGTQVFLEVEIVPTSQGFTGTPSHTGTTVTSGGTSVVTANPLAPNAYHWRARTTTTSNTSSAWISFGTNADGQPDFQFFFGPPPPPDVEDKDKCGLLGLEALGLLGLLAALRRRRAKA